MRGTIRTVIVIVVVGLIGLVLGRSVAAPTTTAEITQWAENDAGARRMVSAVDFRDTPLVEAIESLREQTKANIVVKWQRLEAVGIDQHAPITLRLKELSLQRVLEMICELVGAGTVELAVEEDRGVLVVTTAEDHGRATNLRLYDVRDLVEADTKWMGRMAPMGKTTTQPQFLFGAAATQTSMDELQRIIQDTVAPDSWRDAGGTIGGIYRFNGRFIITQTPENHAKITQVLDLIRKG
jgi:hypothetical protein